MKKSRIFIGLFILGVIAASFLGGNWTTGHAGTVPTIPTIPTIPGITKVVPNILPVGAPSTVITIQGSNFIDKTWTVVRWSGPDNQTINLIPTWISSDGKSLRITVPSSLIKKSGTVKLWVVNHPGIAVQKEAGPLNLKIVNRYYLPMVSKR